MSTRTPARRRVPYDRWFTNGRPGMTGDPVALLPSSGAIARTLDELGLTESTIGVVGLGPHLPWHPEGIIPFRLWNSVLVQAPKVRFTSAEGYRRGTVPPAMHFWSGPDPVAVGWPAWGYRPQAPRVLRDGDVIYAEVFSQFGGREAQNQVTIAVGDVHDDFHRAGDVVRAAYDAGLEALRPGRTWGDVVEAVHAPLDAADGSMFLIALHSLNPGLVVGRGRGDIGKLPGAQAYPAVNAHPAIMTDLVLQPGMSFILEPQYAFGRHLVHVGGTVIVGEDEPVELNPYTAQILRASGTARPSREYSG